MNNIDELIARLEKSLLANFGEDESSAYGIGWELAAAIRVEAEKRHTQEGQDWAHGLSERLAELYKSGDTATRRCIVDGVLEHVLESPAGSQVFELWGSDPELAAALSEAREWARALDTVYGYLEKVASRSLELLRKEGVSDPTIRSRFAGTDVVVLIWGNASMAGQVNSLVIGPGDDLARLLCSGVELTDHDLDYLAKFSVDQKNWRHSNHLSGELWVTLPSPVQH